MSVTLTENAAEQVKQTMESQKCDEGTFLRVGIAGGGCGGFSYQLGFDTNYNEETDSKFNFHGVEVVVDKKSALHLDGTTVDYYTGIDKQGFTFDNPQAVKSCGCGSSFQV